MISSVSLSTIVQLYIHTDSDYIHTDIHIITVDDDNRIKFQNWAVIMFLTWVFDVQNDFSFPTCVFENVPK